MGVRDFAAVSGRQHFLDSLNLILGVCCRVVDKFFICADIDASTAFGVECLLEQRKKGTFPRYIVQR